VSEYTLLVAVKLVRGLIGPSFPVAALRSRRERISEGERAAWEDYAGAPIETGHAKASLVFPAALAVEPLPSHDTELSAYFGQILDQAAPDSEDLGWTQRVRLTLERRLSEGTPTVESVARELGIGARSLARRLAEDGQSFGALLTSVRKERAHELLTDPNITQAEVAFLLCYRDQASFHRALRRWFATTPSVFRRGLPSP